MILIKNTITNDLCLVNSLDGYDTDWTIINSDVQDPNPISHRINEDLTTEFIDIRPYTEKRRLEYPPLEDLADAIYWSNNGNQLLLQAYLDKCAAVKLKYPKPE